MRPRRARASLFARAAAALLLCAACSGPALAPCDGGSCDPQVSFCDAGSVLDTTGRCTAVGWSNCPAGFTADPSGWGCAPIIAAAPCDAGQMPRLGQTDCAPVGWTSCTAGFAPASDGWGCEPVLPMPRPDGGPACSGATREALGSAGCVPVGDCSDAGFPPAGATIFVDDSFAAVDATHFRTISAAMSAAPPTATIAIEAGTYREALAPNRPLNLVGRCPAAVRLTLDGGAAALTVIGPIGVAIEGMTVSGGLLAMRAENGARVTGKRLVLENNRRSAIQALDAETRVTLEESIVRGTQPDPVSGTFGQGIAASYGAQLTLTDVALVGNHETGIFLDRAGTHLEGLRLVVQSTRPRASTGRLGWGVAVQGGATLDLHSTAVLNNQATGLLVTQTGSRATLTDFVIRGTKPGKDNAGGDVAFNAAAQAGGLLELTSGAVFDSAEEAINARGLGTRLTLTNTTIRGLTPALPNPSAIQLSSSATGTLSHVAFADLSSPGLEVVSMATCTLDDVAFVRLAEIAVRAQVSASVTGSHVTVDRATIAGVIANDSATLSLTDCAVLGTRLGPELTGGMVGYGAIAQDRGTAAFERCVFDRNAAGGLYAPGGSLSAKATIVSNTLADPNGEYGQGAVAERGGAIALQGVLLDRNRVAGLQVADAQSNILAIDTLVRDTQADATGRRGRGANVQFGATLVAHFSAFLGNRQVGIFIFGGKATLEDVLVRGTLADPDGAYGNGLEVLTDADVVMTRGALDSNVGIGAVFAEGAGLLDAARVANNAVGLHAQDGSMIAEVDGAPPMRGLREVAVTRSTVFDANVTKLGTGQVTVPMP